MAIFIAIKNRMYIILGTIFDKFICCSGNR